jgi:hypothetical protein
MIMETLFIILGLLCAAVFSTMIYRVTLLFLVALGKQRELDRKLDRDMRRSFRRISRKDTQ